MENTYLNIPEFIWNNIFVLLTTLVCGVIVAIFTSTFLKKKEERTRISGVILEKRIESEKNILSFLEKKLTKEHIPCNDKSVIEQANRILNNYPHIHALQYSTVFKSWEEFHKFFNEYDKMFSENKLWLDEKVRDHLLLINGYFSWINCIPIIVNKINLPNGSNIEDDKKKAIYDKCLLIYGIILDNEISGLIAALDTKVVNSIYKLNLKSPKRSIGRNGMFNKSMINVLKELEYKTILGIEKHTFFGIIVLTTLITCNVDMSKISEDDIEKITESLYDDYVYDVK